MSFETPIEKVPAELNNAEPFAPSCCNNKAPLVSESSILNVGEELDSMCKKLAGLVVPMPTFPDESITALSLPSTLNFIALEPTALSSSTSIRSCVLSRVISPLLLVSESSNLILGLFVVTPIL